MSDVLARDTAWEVPRSFAALLQLVNNGNVSLVHGRPSSQHDCAPITLQLHSATMRNTHLNPHSTQACSPTTSSVIACYTMRAALGAFDLGQVIALMYLLMRVTARAEVVTE